MADKERVIAIHPEEVLFPPNNGIGYIRDGAEAWLRKQQQTAKIVFVTTADKRPGVRGNSGRVRDLLELHKMADIGTVYALQEARARGIWTYGEILPLLDEDPRTAAELAKERMIIVGGSSNTLMPADLPNVVVIRDLLGGYRHDIAVLDDVIRYFSLINDSYATFQKIRELLGTTVTLDKTLTVLQLVTSGSTPLVRLVRTDPKWERWNR